MNFGTLKFMNHFRGYGFVHDDSGIDVFLHASALQLAGIDPATLQDGETRFSYDIETAQKGPMAVDVTLA